MKCILSLIYFILKWGKEEAKQIDNKDLLVKGTLFTHFIHFSDLRSLFQTHLASLSLGFNVWNTCFVSFDKALKRD